MSKRHALIVGGSVGGLFAAHMLRRIGWDVTVLERHAGDLAGRGAGIGTQDALLDIMRHLNLAVGDTTEVETRWCDCLDRDGKVSYEMRLRRITSAWARFYRPLKAALPAAHYRPDTRLDAIEQTPDKVTAIFGDGTRATGDFLIGADGLRSTVRQLLRPDWQPAYAGYVGWRILVDESDIPALLRASLFDRYTFCLPAEGLVVAFPVPGAQSGRRAYNIVWYRPTDDARLADLSTDASGRYHAAGIPPPLIRPELIADMKTRAGEQLAPALAEIIALAPQVFFQPIYEHASPQLVFGRVALLGDAAFVARPHGGAGVTKAALDAVALSDALRSDIDAGLSLYDHRQRRLGDWFVGRSRQLGAYVSASDRQPDVVLRDYNATNAELNALIASR